MDTRRAFTLIEILTVTVIISILVVIVTVAVAAAQRAAQRASIAMQMSQIAIALERYKNEFGEYPPDLFDDDALVRHVKKRWPRLNWDALSGAWPEVPRNQEAVLIRLAINNAYNNGMYFLYAGTSPYFGDIDRLPRSQAGALALWLGGFPNSDGKLSGFYADPENPFTPIEQFDDKVFIELLLGRNVRIVNYDNGCIVPVVGTELRKNFLPIVYFRGRDSGGIYAYIDINFNDVKQIDFPEFGICVPYVEVGEASNNIRWHNPTTYQLIHPGLDGLFGDAESATIRSTNPGTGTSAADLDNLTNFSDYKELKSILP